MSTWIYLECRSHDPVLADGGEVAQHLGRELDAVRGWLRDRERILALVAEAEKCGEWDPYDVDNHYYRNALRFMVAHPRCEIGIRDGYGKDHPVTEATP